MKTIICNNCVSGRIYQTLNQEFNNPFIWNIIYGNDFVQLMKQFDSIDFANVQTQIEPDDPLKHLNDSIKLTLDDRFPIYYVHHHQSLKYKIPTKISNNTDNLDLYYNDMQQYVKT